MTKKADKKIIYGGKMKKTIMSQKGFTLIEIIAVLVILGILAAVAVPKYIDLQKDAADKALSGALAAGASQLYMQYASDLLTGSNSANATTWGYGTQTDVPLGDFKATLVGECGNGKARVKITSMPSGYSGFTAGKDEKTFTMCGGT
jgi:prepilin-type N-terminal cleavage/methylation domain-containing protein